MEALLYDKLNDREVRCRLCSHRCVIAEGKRGLCRVRENRGGTLHTLGFGLCERRGTSLPFQRHAVQVLADVSASRVIRSGACLTNLGDKQGPTRRWIGGMLQGGAGRRHEVNGALPPVNRPVRFRLG